MINFNKNVFTVLNFFEECWRNCNNSISNIFGGWITPSLLRPQRKKEFTWINKIVSAVLAKWNHLKIVRPPIG